jgi:hypothetical protein
MLAGPPLKRRLHSMIVLVWEMTNLSSHPDQGGKYGRQELERAPHEPLRKPPTGLKAMSSVKQGRQGQEMKFRRLNVY